MAYLKDQFDMWAPRVVDDSAEMSKWVSDRLDGIKAALADGSWKGK